MKHPLSHSLGSVDVSQAINLETVSINCNDFDIPPPALGVLPSYPLETDDQVLRAALERDGYLHVKGAMPRELVLNMRRRFFEKIARFGLLKPDSDPEDGIFCGEHQERYKWPQSIRAGDPEWSDDSYPGVISSFHHETETDQFCSNEHMLTLMRRLRPEFKEPHCLRRQLFRTNVPFSGSGILPHYDQRFLRHGPPTFVTAWIPIGDCGPSDGGLIYLQDSQPVGRKIEADLEALARSQGFTEEEIKSAYNKNMTDVRDDPTQISLQNGGRKWLVAGFEAGDVVFHNPFTIHAASENRSSKGVIRFSADIRFVDRQTEFDARWNKTLDPWDGL